MARTIPYHSSDEHFFAHLPEIIEAVLGHVSAKTLHTTAKVNRAWRLVSRRLLSMRSTCTISRFEHHTIYSEELEDIYNEVFSPPRVTVLFTHREVWNSRRNNQIRSAEDRRVEISVNNVHQMSPTKCKMIGCSTERIIIQYPLLNSSSIPNSSSTASLPSPPAPEQFRKGHAFATLPSMQGVNYHTVYVRHAPRESSSWSNVFGLNRNTPVQLAILFSLPPSRDLLVHVASGIRNMYGEQVLIVGGVGHDRLFLDGEVRRAKLVALFVYGDSNNLRAGAVALNNRTPRTYRAFNTNAQELIEEIRNERFNPKFSFLFTSRFINRGNSFYLSACTAFRERFPEVPVLGIYSYGEFCLTADNPGVLTPDQCKPFLKHNSAVYLVIAHKFVF